MSDHCHCHQCGSQTCCCSSKCHEVCHEQQPSQAGKEDCLQKFLELADQAWMEVLKEKIKGHILKTKGSHLDELAKIISEANQKRWQTKMAAKHEDREFHEQVCEFMRHKAKG